MSRLIEFFLSSILITIFSIAFMFFSVLNYLLSVVEIPDCVWQASVRTWIDSNGDGFVNRGEPALRDVEIYVDDLDHQLTNVGWSAVTDQNGDTQINIPVRACSNTIFEIYTNDPHGYRITTQPRIEVNRDFWGTLLAPRVYYFGFIPDQ